MKDKIFTDRESGTYGGLMLSLRRYRDRLEPRPGYKLNRKPREIDCLIIDKSDPLEPMDNDIARIFLRHNIVELKNPSETLSVDTIWKVISYAAQYKSEGTKENPRKTGDITITLLRASKPRKAMRELTDSGYRVENVYPGIYYISGMVDFRMQIVVTGELKGDEFVPLRIQRKNAAGRDFWIFAKNLEGAYTEEEEDYVATVVKYGIYDEENAVLELAEEDMTMYKRLMELFKDDIEKKWEEGKAEGKAEGESERKELEKEIVRLKNELKKAQAAML